MNLLSFTVIASVGGLSYVKVGFNNSAGGILRKI